MTLDDQLSKHESNEIPTRFRWTSSSLPFLLLWRACGTKESVEQKLFSSTRSPRNLLQTVPHNKIMSIDFKDIFRYKKLFVQIHKKPFLDFLLRKHYILCWGFFLARLAFIFLSLSMYIRQKRASGSLLCVSFYFQGLLNLIQYFILCMTAGKHNKAVSDSWVTRKPLGWSLKIKYMWSLLQGFHRNFHLQKHARWTKALLTVGVVPFTVWKLSK